MTFSSEKLKEQQGPGKIWLKQVNYKQSYYTFAKDDFTTRTCDLIAQ